MSWKNIIHVFSVALVVSNSLQPHRLACQAPLSTEFSRQEYWRGSFVDLPDLEMEPKTPASPALAGGFFTTEPPGKPESILQMNAIILPT